MDLNPRLGTFKIDLSSHTDVFVASVDFRAHAERDAQGWHQPTLTGSAAVGGALSSILRGTATFTVDAGRVSFGGSLSIPNVPGSFNVHGTVRPDGSLQIDGIPSNAARITAQEAARILHGLGADAGKIAAAVYNGLTHDLGSIAGVLAGVAANPNQIAGALGALTRHAGAIASALRSGLNASYNTVADALYHGIAWTSYRDVARGLGTLTRDAG